MYIAKNAIKILFDEPGVKGYPADELVFLGAKTTCKDRWRQVINEANRIGDKHLFTLQQGISSLQLDVKRAEKDIILIMKDTTEKKESVSCRK